MLSAPKPFQSQWDNLIIARRFNAGVLASDEQVPQGRQNERQNVPAEAIITC